ncbi:uncharacterized protein LOC130138511 [Syzygium oleosum]|uniref:uncharacterized protein LOC130138511 n=1 Tax=Syzygium oleosum TaxID=219896 RepID=UPI0024B90B75|nr:uncharacterized protein LOC130138511 [Syzygium oleosum]
MKAAFALFLVLVLIVVALQAHAKPMNLQGRQLADASMGRKAVAGSGDATVSSTSAATITSRKTDSTSTTSTSSTPTTATTTGNTDAQTGPQREKNDEFNYYSSTPVDSRGYGHRVIPCPCP